MAVRLADKAPLGAYGLILPDLPAEWLNLAPREWREWRFGWTQLSGARDEAYYIGPDRIQMPLAPDGEVVMEAAARRTVLRTPGEPTPAALVHPYLASTAVAHARFEGLLSFHAGCFVDSSGGVWALLGEREDGKSTCLALLAAAGVPVFADDLLVTDGQQAFAGPRALDLREDTAKRLGLGEHIGVIGSRARWRLHLPAVEPQLPLRGFVRIGWGESTSIERMPLEPRLRVLADQRGLRVGEEAPAAWMQVLRLPVLRFVRPKDWGQADAATAALMAALAEL